jgi:hypothetical protein
MIDFAATIHPDGQIVESNRVLTQKKVETLGRALAQFEQTPLPLTHHFAPGIYVREIFMPAGTIVIGRKHKTEHLNIIERGSCYYVDDDMRRHDLIAPCTFVSKAGAQKVLYIVEDCVWKTVHANPDDEHDLSVLLDRLTEAPTVVPEQKQLEVIT